MWVNKSKQLLWFYDEIFLYYFSGGRRKRNVVGKVVKAHTLEEYIKVSVHQQHPFLSLFHQERVLHKKVHFMTMTRRRPESNQSSESAPFSYCRQSTTQSEKLNKLTAAQKYSQSIYFHYYSRCVFCILWLAYSLLIGWGEQLERVQILLLFYSSDLTSLTQMFDLTKLSSHQPFFECAVQFYFICALGWFMAPLKMIIYGAKGKPSR